MQRHWKSLPLIPQGYDAKVLSRRSCIAVFPSLGLVLNRIKKSGNTSVAAFLWELSGGAPPGSPEDLKAQLRTFRDLSLRDVIRFPTLYSIAVVRDPYTRALSGFRHHVAPGTSPRHAAAAGFGDPTPDGFTRFLHWLGSGHLGYNAHFDPQTSLMYQEPKRFSRLVRLETLVDDMQRVLEDIGQPPDQAERLSQPHEIERAQSGKITGAAAYRSQFYTPEAIDLANEIYARDFRALDYPMVSRRSG